MIDTFIQLASRAQEHKVTLLFEALNSAVDHPGYACDTAQKAWSFYKTVNHSHFKLLVDLYHLKHMHEAPLTIVSNHYEAIAHIHFAGYPKRTMPQDVDYTWLTPVIQKLHDRGYAGYLGHEYLLSAGLGTREIATTLQRINSLII